jgi:arsenate reductase (glutaredoxin)
MARTVTVFGITNCDQVRKTRAWLTEHGVAYAFHDLRKDGLDADRLARWIADAGRDALLNRKGTTWRQLDEAERARVVDDASAQALMLARVTVIRRPVIEIDARLLVGFDPNEHATVFRG